MIKVWDLPTRLFHWSLATLVAVAWLTGEDRGFVWAVHVYSGYLVVLLLLFRLVWGFAGNEHARFGAFVRPWSEVRTYAISLLRLAPPRYLGHNPLGGWMVVLLLLTVALVSLTGLLGVAHRPGSLLYGLVSTPVGRWFRKLHEGIANGMLALVAIHVMGVLADWLLTRDNLIRAMWIGLKEAAPDAGYADVQATAAPARDAVGGSAALAGALAAALLILGAFMVSRTQF